MRNDHPSATDKMPDSDQVAMPAGAACDTDQQSEDAPSNEPKASAEIADSAVASDSVASTIRAARYMNISVAVGLLAVVALVAALYLARAFFVPLLIGILASYTLSPVVSWLNRHRIPSPAGAALVLVALIGGMSWMTISLSKDAATMIEKLPDAARKMRQNLINERTRPTPLQNMQEAVKQIEGAAADAGAKPGRRLVTTRENEPTAWLRNYAVAQSALLFAVVGQAPIVLLLTYFLLASGTHFRLKLVQFVGLSRKQDAVNILDEIDVQVQRYLLSVLVTNVLVGIGTWLAFEAIGIEHAGVWGVIAGVLHFIPYLGPATVAIATGMAGFLQFGSIVPALGTAGVTLLIAGAVGLGFATWLQSRFARVNAAVLFIALLFFGWLWGVWGLLLGGPLVAIAKVICDRVISLKPFGDLLGR